MKSFKKNRYTALAALPLFAALYFGFMHQAAAEANIPQMTQQRPPNPVNNQNQNKAGAPGADIIMQQSEVINGQSTAQNTASIDKTTNKMMDDQVIGHITGDSATAGLGQQEAAENKYYHNDLPRARQIQEQRLRAYEMYAQANDAGAGGSASLSPLSKEMPANADGTLQATPVGLMLTSTGGGGGGQSHNRAQALSGLLSEGAQVNESIPNVAPKVVEKLVEGMNMDEKARNGTAMEGYAFMMEANCECLGTCELAGGGGGSGGGSSGGGGDDVKNAGIYPSLMRGKNIPLKAGKKLNCLVAAIKARVPPSPSFLREYKAKTPAGIVENMKTLGQKAYAAEVTEQMLARMANELSMPSGCDSHKDIDKELRQSAGYEQNKETCLSTSQIAQANGVNQRSTQKLNQTQSGFAGGDNAYRKNTDSTAMASKAVEQVQAAIGGMGGGGASSQINFASGGVNLGRLLLFEDPTFLAMLQDPEFKKMRLAIRKRLPEIYAAEDRMIAQIIRENIGPQTYYAQNENPKPKQPVSDPEMVQKPLEKSASLSQLFGKSGVNIFASNPIYQGVKFAQQETAPSQAMKPTLVSATGSLPVQQQ